jgi:hypothetical protein
VCIISVTIYRVTVKLRKTRFFPKRAEFVGADVLKEGNCPAETKNDTITNLKRPTLFTDLRMLIGFIGFYRNWMPLYETRLNPWRHILKQAPAPGACSKEDEAELMAKLWNADDRTADEKFAEYGETNDKLLESLKREVLAGPTLKRPNPNRRFYVKTDWSAWAQGAVLLQADVSEEVEAAMWKEIHGGQCKFDKAIEGLRLRPIKSISQVRKEKSARHSFVVEASTGRWAFLKFKQHLMGREFTWITDYSGIKKFFETDYEATHTEQRWKLELLRFDFTIVHISGRMLTECDLISRYNTWTSAWREADIPMTAVARSEERERSTYEDWTTGEQTNTPGAEILQEMMNQEPRPIAFSITHPQVRGPTTNNTTELAEAYNTDRTMWIINTGATTIGEAVTTLGFNPCVLRKTDKQALWQERSDAPNMKTMLERMHRQATEEPKGMRWTMIQSQMTWTKEQRTHMHDIITLTRKLGATAAILAYCNMTEEMTNPRKAELLELAKELQWDLYEDNVKNAKAGGHVVGANTRYFVLAPNDITTAWKNSSRMDNNAPEAMETILDVNGGIFEDCNRYQVKFMEELKQPGERQLLLCTSNRADQHCTIRRGRPDSQGIRHHLPIAQPSDERRHHDRSDQWSDTPEIKALDEARDVDGDRSYQEDIRVDRAHRMAEHIRQTENDAAATHVGTNPNNIALSRND